MSLNMINDESLRALRDIKTLSNTLNAQLLLLERHPQCLHPENIKITCRDLRVALESLESGLL